MKAVYTVSAWLFTAYISGNIDVTSGWRFLFFMVMGLCFTIAIHILYDHKKEVVNPLDEADTHFEKIKCPECDHVQTAIVYETLPWSSRIHRCNKCDYVIMESEWDTV